MRQKKQILSVITIGMLIAIILSNSTMQLVEVQDQEEIIDDSGKEWAEEIKAAADPDSFLSVWDTSLTSDGSSASNQIRLPLEDGGVYDFLVVWGDDTNDTITEWDQAEVNHTYGSPGMYTINITGTINGWRFNYGGDHLKICEILQWGALRLGNLGYYFWGCENLHLTTTDTLDLTGTTTLYRMFSGCRSLGSSGNLTAWDVSRVADMSRMFDGASSFNQPLDAWNVSQVTNMGIMFFGASSFNQPLDAWDVSQVTNMRSMFADASSFNQPLDAWNVSQVTNMGVMFYGASSFNQPLDAWDVSCVTSMSSMFRYALSFNQPLNAWDVSNAIYMESMFSSASSFNQPLNAWDVSSVTSISNMFKRALLFNQSLDAWDVSSVTNMGSTFEDASSFNQPLDTWDVSEVLNLRSMFSGASSFNQPLDAWDVSHATYMNYAFYETSLFNHPLNSWDVSSVVNMGYMFFCASSFNQPLNSWNVSSVTSMASTFEDASSFNQPLASWNVSSVTSMNQMFSGASSFDQSLDAWNISSVLNMGEMFKDVTLTTSNYDDMLVSWSLLLLQNDVPFHAGNSQFHAGTAETARQLIIDMFGWTITDGGQVPMAPSAPTLNKIEISSSGNVMLAWNPVEGATIFRIYRSPSPINDVSGLTAIITELTGTTYQDTIFTIGTYYYVVVASNAGGDSPISNCESVLTIKFITVVSPKAGSSWIPKQYYYIEWSSTSSISNVQIELYNNGELVMLIHSEIQNDGKNLWRIPSDLESSETYQIKIFDTSDPSVFGLSAEFEIINNEGSSIPGYSSLFFVSVLGGIATLVMLNRRKST